MSSRRRGIYFRKDVFEMLKAYAEQNELNISQVVNEALRFFFSSGASKFLPEAVKKEAKLEELRAEERRLFQIGKQILRSKIHLPNDVEKMLLGSNRDNFYKNPKIQGVLCQMDEKDREVILRLFEQRWKIMDEIEDLLLEIIPPQESFKIRYGKYGKLEVNFVPNYLVAKTIPVENGLEEKKHAKFYDFKKSEDDRIKNVKPKKNLGHNMT